MQAQFDFEGVSDVTADLAEASDVLTAASTQSVRASVAPVTASIAASSVSSIPTMTSVAAPAAEYERLFSDRLWCDDGWTARVIKNDDDDGWAVAMFKDGEAEPALVGPWTMGRDKKNPKPLDAAAFGVLVKTASEVLRRHEQQRHAMLHKSVFVTLGDADLNITLDIKPSEDDPHAILSDRKSVV